MSSTPSWRSELESLIQPTDMSHQYMESSRVRVNQAMGQPSVAAIPLTSQITVPSTIIDPSAVTSLLCQSCSLAAEAYCPSCDSLSCAGCDTKTHSNAAIRSHMRVAAAGVEAFRVPCAEIHTSNTIASSIPRTSTLVTAWCTICQRGICALCQTPSGTHHGHEICRLNESCAALVASLKQAGATPETMQQKRSALDAQIRALDTAQSNLTESLRSIELQEQSTAHTIVQRLNNVQQLNEVKLSQAIDQVKGDLAVIGEYIATVEGMIPSAAATNSNISPAQQCLLLSRARELTLKAHELSGLQVEPVTLSDLPKETRTRQADLSRFPQLLALLRVKDELLRFAMAARKGLLQEQDAHAATLQSLYVASQKEMEEWMNLSETMSAELRQTKMKCCFCLVPLSGASASTPCNANTNANAQPIATGDHRREQDGLHYFVTA